VRAPSVLLASFVVAAALGCEGRDSDQRDREPPREVRTSTPEPTRVEMTRPCRSSRTQEISPKVARVIGGDGVWAAGFGNTRAIRSLRGTRLKEGKFPIKVLYLVAEHIGVVTVQALSASGEPMELVVGVDDPAHELALDEDSAGRHPLQTVAGYHEYGTYVLVPGPGCFRVIASWREDAKKSSWSRDFQATLR